MCVDDHYYYIRFVEWVAQEAALSALVALLVEAGKGEELAALLQTLRPLFQSLPKAKTAKLVRSIIDAVAKIPGTTELQVC